MSTGCLSLILHAHLPYVRHPEHAFHLEELWFFEAMHETYLPLIEGLRRLERDGIPGTITLSLSAPLTRMMEDDLLADRLENHLEKLIELSGREAARRPDGSARERLGRFYLERFQRLHELYVDTLDRDVVGEFGRLREDGPLELMACAGTHALLPLMGTDASRRVHVRTGCRAFERHFGDSPSGIWLPECGYAPGIDRHLAEADVDFSILEAHGLEYADSPPVWGGASPLISPSGVAFFGRDKRSGRQVWSADSGYPGDPVYREFYRDLGYELEGDALAPFESDVDVPFDTGLKYRRITGDVALDEKALYDPGCAESRARDHAEDFVGDRIEHVRALSRTLGPRTPHLTAPYDAELFGHWWFEGPIFLEEVVRRVADTSDLTLVSPGDYLDRTRRFQRARPGTSTWGEGGYFSVWLDDDNTWIHRHLHNAERSLVELAERLESQPPSELSERAMNQLSREVMLAQASDWAFILKHETAVEYALERTRDHLEAARAFIDQLEEGRVDESHLSARESRYALFPDMDWRLWTSHAT